MEKIDSFNRNTYKNMISQRITSSTMNVFVPKDFSDVASYSYVLKILKKLVEKNTIMKLGYGVYAKARRNQFNNRLYPTADTITIATELFKKLNIEWEYSSDVKDYNSDISTQIPIYNLIKIKKTFNRKLVALDKVYAR